jgi:probable ATP-dependent RNA helicase DDX4
MFSATFEATVQKLAQDLLHDYVFLSVGIVGGACEDVEQCFFNIPKFSKRDKLVEFLKEGGDDLGKVMVFVETKRSLSLAKAGGRRC